MLGNLLAVVIAASALATVASDRANAQDAPGQLSVSGRAEIQVNPDIAVLTLGVVAQEAAAADAMSRATSRLHDIFAVLDELEIAKDDRQTRSFSLDPVYANNRSSEDQPPQILGYRVRNQVRVTIRDVDGVGAAIDRLTRAGVNTFNGIEFEISDPDQYADDLRRRAVEDARHKAEVYAEAAGVGLGRVILLSDGTTAQTPVPVMARAEMAMAMPVAPGTVGLGAGVQMVFEIE